MKLFTVFKKSFIEQIREYWILIFTITTAPFFVFLYYLMVQAEIPVYVIAVQNNDIGIGINSDTVKYSDALIDNLAFIDKETDDFHFVVKHVATRPEGETLLKNKKADLLMILSQNFSHSINDKNHEQKSHVEFVGDLTSFDYMISAIFVSEYFTQFINETTGYDPPYMFSETPLGMSADKNEFDLYVPGLLIFSIIVMILSAAAAIVRESEIQTIKRLKISKLSAFEFLAGTSLVQIIVAFLSLFFTLITAMVLGFQMPENSFLPVLIISFLLSISIIALGLTLAAFCRSVKDVMIIGVFPFFLLMFFTGATFPIHSTKIFSIGDYSMTVHGLLSPSQAVNALNKILNLGMGFQDVLPEITALIGLTAIYFLLGLWAFNKRHMKVS